VVVPPGVVQRFGTLVSTVEALVTSADAGYDAAELEAVLNVEAKQALLKLVRSGRLAREQVAGRYVYLSTQAAPRRAQLAARSVYDAEASRLSLGPGLRVLPDELKVAIVLFYSLLDERQRRSTPGWSHEVGHGGDAQVAELFDIDPGTVARGRQELLAGDITPGRVRRRRGAAVGKKSVPEVIEAIGRLMEHDTAATGQRCEMTRRTTEKIAAELGTAGIVVCPNTVAKLLKASVPAPGQRQETQPAKGPRPRRPVRLHRSHARVLRQAGLPVVSVDSKHRELVGDFKNPGATGKKSPSW